MNPSVRKARKKPIEIEFMVWPGGARNAALVIDWILGSGGTARYNEGDGSQIPEHIKVDTAKASMWARAGDVIVRRGEGDFYTCKPSALLEKYDIINTDQEED